jgi:signal peptidase
MVLTKGDNNELDDVALYPRGQKYVHRDQIIGVVRGYIPKLGWITIWLNEMPFVRYFLIGALFILSLL